MNTTKTQLDNLMSDYNYFTSENLPLVFKKYYDERIKDSKYIFEGKEIPQYFVNSSDFESGLYFKCSTSEDYEGNKTHYIESHALQMILKRGLNIPMMLMSGYHTKGKFYLHPLYDVINKLTFSVDNYEMSEASKKLEKPNLIGVFTDKKVQNWVNYCNDLINAYTNLQNCVANKIQKAQQRVESFISELGENCEFTTYTNVDRIFYKVMTKMFEVTFDIRLKSGFLDERITFKGGLNDIKEITNK